MKKVLFGLILTLVACGQTTNTQEQAERTANLDNYIGVYEYVYPDNTQDLKENHFIVLTKTDDILNGLYYGTSDEFDKAREGYLPGFFVSSMDSLQINGDTIKFVLNTKNCDFLTQPIDLKIQSTEEAIDSGYKNWENNIPTNPKKYIGLIKDSETIIFEAEKEFKRKK